MKIIIVGGGKTGATLAASLNEEGHEVTIIDFNAERISTICNDSDVMGFLGNGMNYSSLTEAGIEDADLMIAVTGSDEQNLLCSLFAKKNKDCSTIARIRNPMYLKETDFIKEQVGLSMVINPEFAGAMEISQLLRFPSAIEVSSFARGRVEMITFKIPEGSVLDGKNLTYVRTKLESDVLFCCVERAGQFTIPSGSFELKAGDKATVMVETKRAHRFFRAIKYDTHSIKSAILVGGGTLSYYLARILLDSRISVKIIEKDEARCNELAELLPDAMIIHGDATDKNLLMEEGIATTDAFVALTGFDEENVLLSLYAKEMAGSIKVITKVDRQIFTELVEGLNLDSIIHLHHITTEHILQLVRAKQNAMGNNVETLYRLFDGKVEAAEFNISQNAQGIGVPLREMNIKENMVICGIIRGKQFILPDGNTAIQSGDRVIVVAGQQKLNDFKDILK